MAHASLADVAASQGDGYFVGHSAAAAELAILETAGLPEDARLGEEGIEPYKVEQGDYGEVVVRGNHVNRGYIDNPEANRKNKLYQLNGDVWHRTGDVAYQDAEGNLWLTGRVKDTVRHLGRSIQPLVLEAKIDAIAGIQRAALIASKKTGNGVVVIELLEGASEREVLAKVRQLLEAEDSGEIPLRVISMIPMDGRHNSKIDRPKLREVIE